MILVNDARSEASINRFLIPTRYSLDGRSSATSTPSNLAAAAETMAFVAKWTATATRI